MALQASTAGTHSHSLLPVARLLPLLWPPQVARTKQILSANTEAPISVEELWQERDFRSTISRDKFEELAGEGWIVLGWEFRGVT